MVKRKPESEEDVFYPPDVAAIKLLLTNREKTRYNNDGDGKPAVVINFYRGGQGVMIILLTLTK